MKKIILLIACCAFALSLKAQDFGLSFSYFIPKDGYFSTPISPFSIRGLGFDLNRFVALETGVTLYRMSGLNLKDLPFLTHESMVGPNFTIFVPVELVLQFKSTNAEFDLKGGVFGFYGFDQKINYGNLDRAIRKYEGWDVANSSFTFKNKPGWGYHFGAEITVYFSQQVGVSLESNYLIGESQFPLTGSYKGGTDVLITKGAEYPDAKIDFTGVEFSIGLIFKAGATPPKPGKSRRR